MSLLRQRLKRVAWVPLNLSTPFRSPGGAPPLRPPALHLAPLGRAHAHERDKGRSSGSLGTEARRGAVPGGTARAPLGLREKARNLCGACAPAGELLGVGRALARVGKSVPGNVGSRWACPPSANFRALGRSAPETRRGRYGTWFGDRLPPGRSRAQSAAATLIASGRRSLSQSGVPLPSLVPQQPHQQRSGQTPSDQQGGPDGAHG